MKKILNLLMLSIFYSISLLAFNKESKVDFVHPLNWFTNMKDSHFQILIHGDNIASMDVQIESAENVRLVDIIKVKNPNYLFLYFDAKDARPQSFNIVLFNNGAKQDVIRYELKEKSHRTIISFNSSDVVYLLMPDRFANGDKSNDVVDGMRESVCDSDIPLARHGGDLKGMTEKIPYLADLGITAIWPTPVLENDMEMESYHGYATTDYYRVDPRIGSIEDYRTFVDTAHKYGIKVIMDLVFNHCGSFNPIFLDLPQSDWFNFDSKYVQSSYRTAAVGDNHASAFDKMRTTDGWFVQTMPDWNQRNPLVKDYLIQSSIWWIETAGIDGIRQDTYPYNDYDALVEWCNRIEKEYPGMNIVGEAWINNNVGVSYWQKDSKLAAPRNSMLPSVMDFPLMSLLNYVCDEETDDWDHGLARLYEYIGQDAIYADTNNLLTFLDNHDTNRFQPNTTMAADTTRYKMALTLLLTLRGIPQLYYGDEIGMAADKSKGDGALRQNFPGGWDGDENNAFNEDGRNNLQKWYFDFTRKLLQWRKQTPAVHYGKLIHFHVRDGVYAYSRNYGGKVVTIFVNGSSKQRIIKTEPYKEAIPSSIALDVLTNKYISVNNELTINPKDVLILDFK